MDLALKPEHIPKITVNTNHETNLDETIQVNRNLQNQNLKVADAILDLSRGTGDASLYGNDPSQTSLGAFADFPS